MIKGVIFDLDQTLIDSLEAVTEAFNAGTALLGLKPVPKEVLARFLDKGLRMSDMLIELYPSVFKEEQKLQTCQSEIRKVYLQLEPEKVFLKPGAKRTIKHLKQRGIKIGIVTGRMSKGEGKWLELRRLHIHQFIDSMVTAAEAPGKPAPDGLIKCMGELGLYPEECIFVGDSQLDIIAGKKAGVKTVALYSGVSNKDTLAEQGPDFVLDNLNSLVSLLSKLQKTDEGKHGSVYRIIQICC